MSLRRSYERASRFLRYEKETLIVKNAIIKINFISKRVDLLIKRKTEHEKKINQILIELLVNKIKNILHSTKNSIMINNFNHFQISMDDSGYELYHVYYGYSKIQLC